MVARALGLCASAALVSCGGGLVGAQPGETTGGERPTGSPDDGGDPSAAATSLPTSAGSATAGDTTDTGPSADATDAGGSDTVGGGSADGAQDSSGTGGATTWCADADGDGAGDPSQCGGEDPGGWVPNADDCDDADPRVALCPDACDSLGPNESCSGDLEAFLDDTMEPSCPTSDLLHDVPAGPEEWAIRTAGAINSQWSGHGIWDHTLGTEQGRLFYSDLGVAVPGTAYWREDLQLQPDTAYVFEVWVKDTATEWPDHAVPVIGVTVDGTPAISGFALPDLPGDYGTYERISFGFQSSASGSVTLEIVNEQAASPSAGLDIAIDDVVVSTCAH